MKTKITLLASALALTLPWLAHGQGTFQNLGFDAGSLVTIPGDPYGRVQFNNAFPGWSGYVGGTQQSAALPNAIYLDSSGISIIGANYSIPYGDPGGAIEGRFTAILQAGVALGTFTPADVTLSQTSLVPLNAGLLQFKAYTFTTFNPLRVFLGGQSLSLSQVASGDNYTLFQADVQAWQGQMAELDFTVVAQRPHQGNNYLFLDSIQFQPIPEPGAVGFFAFGVFLLGWRFSKRRC